MSGFTKRRLRVGGYLARVWVWVCVCVHRGLENVHRLGTSCACGLMAVTPFISIRLPCAISVSTTISGTLFEWAQVV